MGDKQGFIQLRRGLEEHFERLTGDQVKVFIGCLFKASFSNNKRGTFKFNIDDLCEDWGVNRKTLYKNLKFLHDNKYISWKRSKNQWRKSMIYIVKYDLLSTEGDSTETAQRQHRDSTETATRDKHKENKELKTPNNVKNGNNDKNDNNSGTNVPRAQKNINDQNTEVEDGECKDKRSTGSCPTKSGPDHTVGSRSISGGRSSVKNGNTENYKISDREPDTPRAKQHNNIIPNSKAVTFPAAGDKREILSERHYGAGNTGGVIGDINMVDIDKYQYKINRGENVGQPTENNISGGGEIDEQECRNNSKSSISHGYQQKLNTGTAENIVKDRRRDGGSYKAGARSATRGAGRDCDESGELNSQRGDLVQNETDKADITATGRIQRGVGNSTASDKESTPLHKVFDPEKHDMGVGDSCMGGGEDNARVVRQEPKRGEVATGRHRQDKEMERIKKEKLAKIFETEFWPIYPKRNGRKIGKKITREWFLKNFKIEDTSDLITAVKNYVADGQLPRDPIRFLRGKEEFWREFIETVKCEGGDNAGHNKNSGYNQNTKRTKPRLESGLKKCLRDM